MAEIEELADMSAEAEKPLDQVFAQGVGERSDAAGEMSLTSLVHLLGLPTSSQIDLIETKLELVATKLNSLAQKLERSLGESHSSEVEVRLGRIDLQLAELRAVLKKALAAGGGELKSGNPDPADVRSNIAERIVASTPIAEDNSVGQAAPGTSAGESDFQQSEGLRIREQVSEKKVRESL